MPNKKGGKKRSDVVLSLRTSISIPERKRESYRGGYKMKATRVT